LYSKKQKQQLLMDSDDYRDRSTPRVVGAIVRGEMVNENVFDVV
jgi:hypothetical protein